MLQCDSASTSHCALHEDRVGALSPALALLSLAPCLAESRRSLPMNWGSVQRTVNLIIWRWLISSHRLFSAQDPHKNTHRINLEILFFLFPALRFLFFFFLNSTFLMQKCKRSLFFTADGTSRHLIPPICRKYGHHFIR